MGGQWASQILVMPAEGQLVPNPASPKQVTSSADLRKNSCLICSGSSSMRVFCRRASQEP